MRTLAGLVLACGVGCGDLPCGDSAAPVLRADDGVCVRVSAVANVEIMREPDSCSAAATCVVLMPGEQAYFFHGPLADEPVLDTEAVSLDDGLCPLSCPE